MFNTFVSQANKDPLICFMPMAVFVRHPLLRVRKGYSGPTMPLEQELKELAQGEEAEEEKKHLPISQLWERRKRVEPTESIIPLAMVDPNRKATETTSSKP